MIEMPLLHVRGATEGTTQWRAETIQMVNWGGFQGHHQATVSANNTLLSGASGTGKSTLFDAYLALMMPSDTPFNGASNDATTGRARGQGQRNLLTYLRGKTDDSPDTGDGDLSDQVLRGADAPTWGAVAMTFVDDNQRRFTALRLYFAPRGITKSSDVSMKLATTDGPFDLSDLEDVADTRFDKRALKIRFPELRVWDTYSTFAQTLHTRLGIGANGDGGKALRLLARIQAGHQVKTVDGLYKSMVLEQPVTYSAADNAISHFVDLEKSYFAMEMEAQKAKVLEKLPDLHIEYTAATQDAETIDTFGVHRTGDTPFTLWSLRTERGLLDHAVHANRAARRVAHTRFLTARDKEIKLAKRMVEVQKQQRENGGDALASLQNELNALDGQREETLERRATFDHRIEPLSVSIQSMKDLAEAQTVAERFLKTFAGQENDLDGRRKAIHRQQYPIEQKTGALKKELESLSGRNGLVPAKLHDVRMMIAKATGVPAEDLPFVAELIDLAPGQEEWRKATELTLSSVARIILVDETKLDHVSRTIDPLHLRPRVNFEGVKLQPHQDFQGDRSLISGKLIFKDSLFSRWVQGRVQVTSTDALCVDSPSKLGGNGPRVTITGQTRNAKRGAHGETNTGNIIGFSNKARLAEIEAEIAGLVGQVEGLSRRASDVGDLIGELRQRKDAHQFILLNTSWTSVDVDGVKAEIEAKNAEHDRILASSDVLRALKDEEDRLTPEVDDTQRVKFRAEGECESLDEQHVSFVDRQDSASDHIDRIDLTQSVSLSELHSARLDAEFAAVSATDDLFAFNDGVERLRLGLLKQSQQSRSDAQKASDSLTRTFVIFQDHWPDPNLGVAMASYSGYRDILDNILTTGLHTRRKKWKRRLSQWSGEDLVPLNGAFETAIEEIEARLSPVNDILSTLPFGAGRDRLKIALRRLHTHEITKFRSELKSLSSGTTEDTSDEQIEARFLSLRVFMDKIRSAEDGSKGTAQRDNLLDVRKHVEITAVRLTTEGVEKSSYASLGGKSGGETQELVAFIVGAALRFQLGDESRTRPRFAPVFLDEGFVKADAQFAGRSVAAWKGLGFQLIVGVPLDKVTALEPFMDVVLSMTKNVSTGYSYITPLPSTTGAVT